MKKIEEKAINTIRFLAVDAIEKAASGHPGLPMGGAAMAYVLWTRFLKHDAENPDWPDRDRFVLSAGHGSMLLYALLHLSGYDLSLEEIKNFRQLGSRTPGHPEYGVTPGVETTTGPLGQGFANAVGMAVAEERLRSQFNRPGYELVDHYTYVYAGDGCMMEGITMEAASLAGHLKLGRLICLYDDNEITIDGSTSITFTEDIGKRFAAFGWQVIKVADGNDLEAVENAIARAREEKERPSFLMIKTQIGYGSPQKQGSAAAHGAPLGEEEVRRTKENLGWPQDPEFYVPDEVYRHFQEINEKLKEKRENWQELFESYQRDFPEEAESWEAYQRWGEVPQLREDEGLWQFDKPLATRAASGQVMQVLKKYVPNLMGGSADLTGSTKTFLDDMGVFQPQDRQGNNLYFGVREHAMGGICNGIAVHGGLRPYCSTFLVFADYMKGAIRMAALSRLPVIFVFTHDSIGVGEDGPTHQPIEQLPMLRAIPNLHVLRPADGRETAVAWLHALSRKDGPTALILTRQKLPQLSTTGSGAQKGAYILRKEEGEIPQIILMASGSEVSLIWEAGKLLEERGIQVRLISVMSWELFLAQPDSYQQEVLPAKVKKRIGVEAAYPLGWEKFVGDEGRIMGIRDFGVSAPGEVIMGKMGFTTQSIVNAALGLME